jgi:hypothetical protein
MKERLRGWFRPATFAGSAALLLITVAALHPLPGRVRSIAEATVYLLLILACASVPAVRRIAGGLGAARLAILGTVFVVSVGVQVAKSYGPLYPFVRWTMYGSATPGQQFPVYEATYASGRTAPFPFTEVTPSRSPRAFLTHFSRQLRRIHEAGGHDPEAERELSRLFSHVAGIYNARNPADPIVSVRAGGCTVRIHDYVGPESLECAFVAPIVIAAEPVP